MEKYVPYQAYLLRLRPARRGGVATFRVSLESVATGERQDLPDLESLFAFLLAQKEEWGKQKPLQDDSEGQDNGYSTPFRGRGEMPGGVSEMNE